MTRTLHHGDITSLRADALVYSTNVQLMLSGGVGASLLQKYGPDFQRDLYREIDARGRKLAEVGEVLITTAPDSTLILHTVATDPLYHSDERVVAEILRQALEICSERDEIDSVLISALGCGYGDLSFAKFLELLSVASLRQESLITEMTLAVDDADFYSQLVVASEFCPVKWNQNANKDLQDNLHRSRSGGA